MLFVMLCVWVLKCCCDGSCVFCVMIDLNICLLCVSFVLSLLLRNIFGLNVIMSLLWYGVVLMFLLKFIDFWFVMLLISVLLSSLIIVVSVEFLWLLNVCIVFCSVVFGLVVG